MQFIKEPIFISAIRAFFNAFLAMIGIVIGFVILLVVGMGFSSKGAMGSPLDMVTLEILPNAEGKTVPLTDSVPVILQIDVEGVIGMDMTMGEYYENYLRLSEHSNYIKPDKIKGIFLNIASPGGVVSDSDIIYRSLMAYKEKHKIPVYSFSTIFCASGAYMAACASDKIFTTPTCIVGSVGVKTGPFFNYHGLMDKYGVKAVEITAGTDKIKYPSFTPVLKDGDKDSTQSYQDLTDITQQLYVQFTTLVGKSRSEHGLTQNDLVEKYGARVFLAPQAQKLGYVDVSNATRSDVLQELVTAAGIEEGENYAVVRFKHKQSPLKILMTSCCKMWTMRASEWITGIKHQGALDGKLLYHYDISD